MKLEDLIVTLEAVRNLGNLRKDIASNVADYKRRLANGDSVTNVQAVIDADAAEYQRRLAWHDEADVAEELAAGLAALGIEDYEDEKQALSDAVSALTSAPKGSREDIEALDIKSLATRKTLFKPKNG